MEKLKMQTENLADKNFAVLSQLFPNSVTETVDENGVVIRSIDADVLRQEIACKVVEGREERYQFTWPNKKAAVLMANSATNSTLRPCRSDSVDFDETKNIYIEGDNLETLRLLQEAYLNQIQVIYIDPPYNTGGDMIYEDSFAENVSEYVNNSGQIDSEGNKLVQNNETNGRFHTDWLNMLYPRIKLARNLLKDSGVIFVSIDDHEVTNARKILDEVFGEKNFIAQVVWERAFAPINLKKHFSECHDYILCYAKSIEQAICNGLPRNAESDSRYSNPDNDPRGVWQSDNSTVGPAIPEKVYEITTPNGRKILPPNGRCWLYTKERFQEMINDNRIWFGADGNNVPRVKRFLSEVKQGLTPMTIWKYSEVGHSQEASQNLKKLFNGKSYFTYPKPVELIKRCIRLYSEPDCIVMDFFSGSATTAQAVMEINQEDNSNLQFIMVQLPEKTDAKSDAYKDGLLNICEIGRERIRRAGESINIGDKGFRAFKVDSTNMKDVYYNPSEMQQTSLFAQVDNIKEDRTEEDLLFQVMLELNIMLSSKIEIMNISNKHVYSVDNGYLLACFDDEVTDDVVKTIAQKRPYYAVFRDSSMANDSVATNFDQIFASISPDTVRKVL